MMRVFVFLLAMIAGPASAQAVFTPPSGCEGVVTIQSKSCLLTNVWQCEADPEGYQWVGIFNRIGPFQIRRVDAEFQWLESFFLNPPHTETMVVPAPDPENLTELFRDMLDIYDFTVVPNNGDIAERFVGFDRLTGESIVIDGETLLRTEFAYDVLDPAGNMIKSRAGRQFVSEKHRIFLFGESWDVESPDRKFDGTPIEFIYPGEPGFFSLTPRYECGAIMSSFPVDGGT